MIRQGWIVVVMLALACGAAPTKKAEVPSGFGLVEVAQNLDVPWAIAFAPDGRVFVTEREGRVRVVDRGKLLAQPALTITGVVARGEAGLMGLTLHPDFASNRYAYLCYATEQSGRRMTDVVERYREDAGKFVEPTTILDRIPAARFHAGCRLRFGPDRKLYITTGDATNGEIAQDLRSLGGKILRINDDGSIPADNPFPGSPVWTSGHRNPQGIDWDPVSGLLFSTEHGPSGFDGGSGGDEVNIVERGKNYGWPVIHHRETRQGMEAPLLEYSPACAPASAAFWRDDFWFGCLRGERLQRVVLDPKDRRRVVRQEELFSESGRIREVIAGPDGALYITTSNRDGRGERRPGDDRIYKVVQK